MTNVVSSVLIFPYHKNRKDVIVAREKDRGILKVSVVYFCLEKVLLYWSVYQYDVV